MSPEGTIAAEKPVRKSRIAARNEAKILDAAQEVIAEYGFHGATVDMIAEHADMSKPNLHYYFRTKTVLYEAVLKRTLDTWLASLSKLDPHGDPRQELSSYIAEKIDMSMQAPLASRVFANEILRGAPLLERYLKTELRQLVAGKARVIQGWIDAGKLRPINPAHLIFLIWAATQHYADFMPQVCAVLDRKRLTQADFENVKASLTDIILAGVLPR